MLNTDNTAGPVPEPFELSIRKAIRERLESLTLEEKKILRIAPFEAVIPEREEHVDIHIRGYAYQLAQKIKYGSVEGIETILKLRAMGIPVLYEPHEGQEAAIEQVLRSFPLEKLRIAGVFFEGNTQENADRAMKAIEDMRYEYIRQAMDDNR